MSRQSVQGGIHSESWEVNTRTSVPIRADISKQDSKVTLELAGALVLFWK